MIDASKDLELKDAAPGALIYVRSESLHPRAKSNLFDTYGHRTAAFLINRLRFNVAFLDVRYRARRWCENRIKILKNTRLGKLPYWYFAANEPWAELTMIAVNLVSWQLLAKLLGGQVASARDVKLYVYRMFSVAGKASSAAVNTSF